MITLSQLKQIMPHARSRADEFLEPLNSAIEEFDINTPQRQAAFLAQAAHESGELRYMKELASGQAYEGRLSLGNDEPGEGVRYKGRGIFQLTGDSNYRLAGTELWGDPDWLTYNPQFAEEPENACRIAGWYWKRNGLNELADADNFRRITMRINGGLTHYDDRLAYFKRAKEAIA